MYAVPSESIDVEISLRIKGKAINSREPPKEGTEQSIGKLKCR